MLGGPESANYIAEYLGAGADVIVIGEGEVTLAELLPALPRQGVHRLQDVPGIAFRDESGAIVQHRAAHARAGHRLAAVSGPRSHRPRPLPECLENASRRQQHQSHHRARLRVSMQLVFARRVRTFAPAPQPGERGRRNAVDHRSLRSRPGLVRRRRVHHQPPVARQLHRRAQAPRHSSPVRNHHARRPPAERRRGRAAARARLLSHLDRLGERQPEDPRRHAARREGRAGAPRLPARARSTASRSACS